MATIQHTAAAKAEAIDSDRFFGAVNRKLKGTNGGGCATAGDLEALLARRPLWLWPNRRMVELPTPLRQSGAT